MRIEKMPKPLCIYHGNCADGFTSAWAVWKRFGDEFEYVAGIYGKGELPDVDGRHVVIVDFSYKREVLAALAARSASLLVLDHHKSAAADLMGLPYPAERDGGPTWGAHLDRALRAGDGPAKAAALFDMDRSGAGIVWDFFHPRTRRPRLINYVEDRDLWRFKLPHSREISAALFSWAYSFQNWDAFATILDSEAGFIEIARQGGAIERKHHKDVAELVAVCRRRVTIGGVEVWAASLPYTLTSDAGNLMAQGEAFAACYWDTPDGRVFSLRSDDDGADVSMIAAQYGGGGHKHAAGFTLPFQRLAEVG